MTTYVAVIARSPKGDAAISTQVGAVSTRLLRGACPGLSAAGLRPDPCARNDESILSLRGAKRRGNLEAAEAKTGTQSAWSTTSSRTVAVAPKAPSPASKVVADQTATGDELISHVMGVSLSANPGLLAAGVTTTPIAKPANHPTSPLLPPTGNSWKRGNSCRCCRSQRAAVVLRLRSLDGDGRQRTRLSRTAHYDLGIHKFS